MALHSNCAKLLIHLVRAPPEELGGLIDSKQAQILRTGRSDVWKVCEFLEFVSPDSTRVHGGLNLVKVNIVPRPRA